MAVNKTKLTGGGEIGEVNKKKSLPVRILEWVKSHKKPLLISLVLGVALIGGIFVGKAIWDEKYGLSQDEEAKILEEARAQLRAKNVNGADEKYQVVISKKFSKNDKAYIYQIQSKDCGDYNYYDCSLRTWEKSGELSGSLDYKYYLTLGNLLRINNDQSGSSEAYKKALADMSNRTNLSDDEKQLQKQLEDYFNEN